MLDRALIATLVYQRRRGCGILPQSLSCRWKLITLSQSRFVCSRLRLLNLWFFLSRSPAGCLLPRSLPLPSLVSSLSYSPRACTSPRCLLCRTLLPTHEELHRHSPSHLASFVLSFSYPSILPRLAALPLHSACVPAAGHTKALQCCVLLLSPSTLWVTLPVEQVCSCLC